MDLSACLYFFFFVMERKSKGKKKTKNVSKDVTNNIATQDLSLEGVSYDQGASFRTTFPLFCVDCSSNNLVAIGEEKKKRK